MRTIVGAESGHDAVDRHDARVARYLTARAYNRVAVQGHTPIRANTRPFSKLERWRAAHDVDSGYVAAGTIDHRAGLGLYSIQIRESTVENPSGA